MLNRIQIRIAVAVAAVVWLLIALFTNEEGSAALLKTVSVSAAVVTFLFLAYDRFIWKWKFVRAVTGKPTVSGTWRGELRSDYKVKETDPPLAPIPTVLRVMQTNSTLLVTLFTGESRSVTEHGRMICDPDNRWRMSWTYVNDPRASVQYRSNQHRGSCDLELSGKDGEKLVGKYFTSRNTTGEMVMNEWSKHNYNDAESALAGADFGVAKPFVRWFRK